MVTVSDREGIELLTACKTRWRLDIPKSDMIASQETDFTKGRQPIYKIYLIANVYFVPANSTKFYLQFLSTLLTLSLLQLAYTSPSDE